MTQPAPDVLPVKFEDGVRFLPRQEAITAVASGEGARATPEDVDAHRAAQLATASPIASKLGGFAVGAVRGLGSAMGLSTDKLAVDTSRFFGGEEEAQRTRDTLKDITGAAPTASKAGEFGGVLAPALLGDEGGVLGAVGEGGEGIGAQLARRFAPAAGEEAGLGARVATKALEGGSRAAAEGAQLSVVDAENESSIENKPLTGEQLFASGLRGAAGGAALGGLLGAGGEALSSGASKIREAIGGASVDRGLSGVLADKAEEQGVRALFQSSDQATMRKLEALPGGAKGASRQFLDDGIYSAGDSVEHLAPKIAEAKEASGARLGDLVDEADKSGAAGPSAADVIKQLREKVMPEFQKAPSLYQPEINRLNDIISDIAATGAEGGERLNMTFSSARKLRGLIDQKIKDFAPMPGAPPNSMQNMLKAVRGTLEDHVETALDDAGEKLGRDAGKLYREEKLKFRRYAVADTALQKSVTKINANRAYSPSDYGGAIIGAASGHGLLGMAGGALHKLVRERGNATMAVALNKAARMAALQRASSSVADEVTTGLQKFFAGEMKAEALPRLDAKKIDAIQEHLSDPAAQAQGLQQHLGNLPNHAPQIAAQVAATHQRAVSYLAAQIPKPLAVANNMQPQLQKKRYAPQDVTKFARVHQVVADPTVVPRLLGTGQLTADHVQALKEVYPAIYQEIQNLVQQKVSTSKKAYSYSQRCALSLLFDEPLDATMNPVFIQDVQASYAANPAPPSPGAKAPKRPLKLSGASTAPDPEG